MFIVKVAFSTHCVVSTIEIIYHVKQPFDLSFLQATTPDAQLWRVKTSSDSTALSTGVDYLYRM